MSNNRIDSEGGSSVGRPCTRPCQAGPDELDEGEIERNPMTALNEAVQQYFDELHAEV
jgi:hypothetical protein